MVRRQETAAMSFMKIAGATAKPCLVRDIVSLGRELHKVLMSQEICIDCAPGHTRPSDLLITVLRGTGIEPRSASLTSFGEHTFLFDDVSPEKWKEALPTVAQRCTTLYNRGTLRYASWR